jgi:hypothetical protein
MTEYWHLVSAFFVKRDKAQIVFSRRIEARRPGVADHHTPWGPAGLGWSLALALVLCAIWGEKNDLSP